MSNYADKFVSFLYMSTYKNFIKKNVLDKDTVLDVGSGHGFLKPLVEGQGASYLGVDPRSDVYKKAVELYGKTGFEKSLLSENKNKDRYDKLFILTVLDEVPNKAKFLNIVKSYGDCDSRFFFAVRNANFPFRKSNLISSNIDGTEMKDLDYNSWIRLLEENGFNVVKIEKFKRPPITSFTLTGLKSFLLLVFFYTFPLKKSYMLMFTLKIVT